MYDVQFSKRPSNQMQWVQWIFQSKLSNDNDQQIDVFDEYT